MTRTTTRYRVSRALTGDEMRMIVDNARRSATTGQLVFGIVADLYNALLDDDHRSIADLDVNRPLRPGEYAIPTTQWEAIMHEATGRAAAWGTSAATGLELVNVKPDTYDDPQASTPPADTDDHRPTSLALHVTREAVDTVRDVTQYLGALATGYGPDSDVYRHAADSWLRHLPLLFNLGLGGDTIVRRDGGAGSLSLLVETASGTVFGIIFHQHRRHCLVPGCPATIDDHGTVGDLDERTPIADHQHRPSSPLCAPAPGEWLAHS
ncbi:MAG: hypothetical protein KJO75_23190 [Dactylosporangium sp.]|nr:hypothetical protein [Dactylosporangium sp.]